MEHESNDTTTLEEWKARALRAEAIVYALKTGAKDLCFMESSACDNCNADLDDQLDGEEWVYEVAAEAVGDPQYDLDDMPDPPDVVRRQTDKPLIKGTDRELYAAMSSPHANESCYVLVVCRSDTDVATKEEAVRAAWRQALIDRGVSNATASGIGLHTSGRASGERVTWPLTQLPRATLRRALLEAPVSREPVTVAAHFPGRKLIETQPDAPSEYDGGPRDLSW